MKPRVFLGSSVEGLSVAYAIQTNLTHDAEITIWSQGVFELSKTTIESLFDILNNVDFGIFVFTPDDLTKMRDTTTAAVRDNVLFEFGLFLGKLGRERVFFIIPSDNDLHLPTDLLGITPAKYESKREDDNFAAATGVACHQIRLAIKKLGFLQQVEQTSNTPEIVIQSDQKSSDWFIDFYSKRYVDAIVKIEAEIDTEKEKVTLIQLKLARAICKYKIDEKDIQLFDDIIIEYHDEPNVYIFAAELLLWQNYIDRAISILKDCENKFGNSIAIINILAQCHLQNGDKEQAIECLDNDLTIKDPNTSIKYANIYIDDKDFETARIILHKAYSIFPNNKELCFNYASVATDLNMHKIALFLYDKLVEDDSDNVSYNGYLGNSCLNLNLNDIALTSYQKANELSEESKEWIISNIGNVLKNRGFYTEGIKFLRKGIELNNSSDYALERLSKALKLSEEEKNEYNKFVKEGRKMIKEFGETLKLL